MRRNGHLSWHGDDDGETEAGGLDMGIKDRKQSKMTPRSWLVHLLDGRQFTDFWNRGRAAGLVGKKMSSVLDVFSLRN